MHVFHDDMLRTSEREFYKQDVMLMFLPAFDILPYVPNEVTMFPYSYDSSFSLDDNVARALSLNNNIGYDIYFQGIRTIQNDIMERMSNCVMLHFPLSPEIVVEHEIRKSKEHFYYLYTTFGTMYYYKKGFSGFPKYKPKPCENSRVTFIIGTHEYTISQYANYEFGRPTAFIPLGQQNVSEDLRIRNAIMVNKNE